MNTRLRSNYLIQPICNSLKLTAVFSNKSKKKEEKKQTKIQQTIIVLVTTINALEDF